MEQGYYVDVNGVEYNYTIGKLNFDDWVNEDPVAQSRVVDRLVSSEDGSKLFSDWMSYANAVPFGVAGFDKGFTKNKQ